MREIIIRIPIIFLIFQILFAYHQNNKIPKEYFPYIVPERVGVSSDSLDVIMHQLDSWVTAREIVGAELLIIKRKSTILHVAVGFYSTAVDYARFLAMWMDWGVSGDNIFLKPGTIKLAFESNPFDPTYARHWNIFKRPAASEERLPAFGHIGDFGTMAYAVPESDLIICFLTQSRYNKIFGEFLALVERLLY